MGSGFLATFLCDHVQLGCTSIYVRKAPKVFLDLHQFQVGGYHPPPPIYNLFLCVISLHLFCTLPQWEGEGSDTPSPTSFKVRKASETHQAKVKEFSFSLKVKIQTCTIILVAPASSKCRDFNLCSEESWSLSSHILLYNQLLSRPRWRKHRSCCNPEEPLAACHRPLCRKEKFKKSVEQLSPLPRQLLLSPRLTALLHSLCLQIRTTSASPRPSAANLKTWQSDNLSHLPNWKPDNLVKRKWEFPVWLLSTRLTAKP